MVNLTRFSGIFKISEPPADQATDRRPLPKRIKKVENLIDHLSTGHPRFQTASIIEAPAQDGYQPVQGYLLTEEDTVQFWKNAYGENDKPFKKAFAEYERQKEAFQQRYQHAPPWYRPKKLSEYFEAESQLTRAELKYRELETALIRQRRKLSTDDPQQFQKKFLAYVDKHKAQDQTTGSPMIPFKTE